MVGSGSSRKQRRDQQKARWKLRRQMMMEAACLIAKSLPSLVHTNARPPPKKRRYQHGRVKYKDSAGTLSVLPPTMSPWYILYCKEESPNLLPNFHRKFRNRFRLPYSNFLELVKRCTDDSNKPDGYFKRWRPGNQAAGGKPAAPLELLVLTSLRYLGRGWTFDDLTEATAISEEVIRTFFHQFCSFGADVLFKEWVRPPTSAEEAMVMCCEEYTAAGFPGCCGSMDATHVEHSRISFRNRQAHLSFKLPFPARAYNLITNHRRRIFSTTDGHPSRWNDKTLVRYDELATGLHDGTSPLCNIEFELYEYDPSTGRVRKEKYKGGWLLVDNGYLNWGVTIPPIKEANTTSEWRFSKWLESMRKDVECTFGIMKGRWRVLKSGIRVHGTDKGDRIWKTCAALHNWLLEADGLDDGWNSDWSGNLGELNEHNMPNALQTLLTLNNMSTVNYDTSGMGQGNHPQPHEGDEDVAVHHGRVIRDDTGAIIVREMSTEQFRRRLVVHFDIAFKRKELCWPTARLGREPNME
ncbi:plant transposon protein [Nitzschia inconspicua]|uniref:Plant transposon protein n=1 Tax=Nitzschia inconspicua TaxID=303405 RepID=A0A9K3LMM9_9STRA|nr:plant transposon protein [Nitzschia inconspicua]